MQEAVLGFRSLLASLPRLVFASFLAAAIVPAVPAVAQTSSSVKTGREVTQQPAQNQQIAKLQLANSETLFSTFAAINSCGYDQDLSNSDPVRAQIRSELNEIFVASSAAALARDQLCRYYHEKQQPDPSRDLAQYVSLALYLKEPPAFSPTVRESDLPPDAYEILGFIPLLRSYYEAADLHRVWLKHQRDMERLIARIHDPVSDMILKTDFYLKLPQSTYLGRRYIVFVEPMVAPGQINARNYGLDYFLVVSPNSSGTIRMEQVRHTYLHFILDTLALKRANVIKRLDPLLLTVKNAPMDDSFKNDTALLVIESLIQAIEARTMTLPPGQKDAALLEKSRNQAVEAAMQQGYILARYFYDALVRFEQDPAGLRDAFNEMLNSIDVDREKRRASNITFSAKATPELVRASALRERQLLDFAEEKLSTGDAAAAHRFAQQALDQHEGDPGRATFVLARAAILEKDIDGAQILFERTLELAHEPRTVGWSHIYIGRILDLKCSRDSALSQYHSALTFADSAPDIKAAADRGIRELPPGCGKDDDKK